MCAPYPIADALYPSNYLFAASAALSHMTGSSGGSSSSSSSYKEPLFITQSAAFKFVAGDTITLPCDVTNPG